MGNAAEWLPSLAKDGSCGPYGKPFVNVQRPEPYNGARLMDGCQSAGEPGYDRRLHMPAGKLIFEASRRTYGSPRMQSAARHALPLTGDRPRSRVSGAGRAHSGDIG
jgi:hypothetical protein